MAKVYVLLKISHHDDWTFSELDSIYSTQRLADAVKQLRDRDPLKLWWEEFEVSEQEVYHLNSKEVAGALPEDLKPTRGGRRKSSVTLVASQRILAGDYTNLKQLAEELMVSRQRIHQVYLQLLQDHPELAASYREKKRQTMLRVAELGRKKRKENSQKRIEANPDLFHKRQERIRERQRELQRIHKEKLRQDPEKYQQLLSRRRELARERYQLLSRQRELARERYQDLRQDPEKYQQLLSRQRELARERYQDPEHRAKYLAKQKAWRDANKDKVREMNRRAAEKRRGQG